MNAVHGKAGCQSHIAHRKSKITASILMTPHVVIVGGGFGGLDAARTLDGAPVRVTLVDRFNYHLFQPLLYQVATASLSPGDIASPIRWILRRQKNVQVLLANVASIDVSGRRVLLEAPSDLDGVHPRTGEPATGIEALAYDYLVIAAGSAHAYFGHSEWQRRAPGLKTLDDALDIRRRVLLAFEAAERERDPDAQRRLLTFAIVGGGPTGVELAGALAEIARRTLRQDFRNIHPESSRIMLIEGAPHLLGAFPARLREAARQSLEKLGVEIRTGALVTRVDDDGVTWKAAGGSGGEEHAAAATILWAAGVAASPIARSLDVPLDRVGRVLAESTLAVPGRPGVFVAGDICALQQDGHWLPGVAQVAKQQGAHAARNILRAVRREPLEAFRYRDYGNAATIGRGAAVVDIGPIKASGAAAWFFWLFLHIFWLIGFRNRIAVLSEWAWSYVTFQRRVRLITGGGSTSGPGERRA
jgi:NADH dehydrogenase